MMNYQMIASVLLVLYLAGLTACTNPSSPADPAHHPTRFSTSAVRSRQGPAGILPTHFPSQRRKVLSNSRPLLLTLVVLASCFQFKSN